MQIIRSRRGGTEGLPVKQRCAVRLCGSVHRIAKTWCFHWLSTWDEGEMERGRAAFEIECYFEVFGKGDLGALIAGRNLYSSDWRFL
jgi:hypothetical protein